MREGDDCRFEKKWDDRKGKGTDSTTPSPGPSPGQVNTTTPTPTTITTTTTTTPLGTICRPGNANDQCTIRCAWGCEQSSQCTLQGTIGCDGSACVWKENSTLLHGGLCESPHSTTTTSTTPSGPCMPHTLTDPCYTRGTNEHSESSCEILGPIGCQHQICTYFATDDGKLACGSAHSTTTVGPCVPGTRTDRCFEAVGVTDAADCSQLGPQGCDGAACTWVDGATTTTGTPPTTTTGTSPTTTTGTPPTTTAGYGIQRLAGPQDGPTVLSWVDVSAGHCESASSFLELV